MFDFGSVHERVGFDAPTPFSLDVQDGLGKYGDEGRLFVYSYGCLPLTFVCSSSWVSPKPLPFQAVKVPIPQVSSIPLTIVVLTAGRVVTIDYGLSTLPSVISIYHKRCQPRSSNAEAATAYDFSLLATSSQPQSREYLFSSHITNFALIIWNS